jgi:glycine/D-amino acid oxidase-like deaminating enzyme
MAETEPLGRPLATSVADGNSLRYYPVFAEFTHLLPAADPAWDRFRIQLLCQQRLDGSLTIGDTHEYDEPFDFDLQDAAMDVIVQLASSVVGSPFPRIRRRWSGIYHQMTDGAAASDVYFRRELETGVIAVTGAGGRGMTLSPAIAEATFR